MSDGPARTFQLTLDANEVMRERTYTLMKSAFTVIGGSVEGDFAEFGTGNGVSFSALAASMKMFESFGTRMGHTQRSLHGFDSFQGLPASTHAADTESPMVKLGIWHEGACMGHTPEGLFRLAADHLEAGNIHIHQGWFKDSLPKIPAGQKFALVHLDCDLFSSTREVLDYFAAHNHFADGCIVLLDDYLENRGSPELGQRSAWMRWRHSYSVTDLGPYARAGWRFMLNEF